MPIFFNNIDEFKSQTELYGQEASEAFYKPLKSRWSLPSWWPTQPSSSSGRTWGSHLWIHSQHFRRGDLESWRFKTLIGRHMSLIVEKPKLLPGDSGTFQGVIQKLGFKKEKPRSYAMFSLWGWHND